MNRLLRLLIRIARPLRAGVEAADLNPRTEGHSDGYSDSLLATCSCCASAWRRSLSQPRNLGTRSPSVSARDSDSESDRASVSVSVSLSSFGPGAGPPWQPGLA
jgi:hypothetical protein